MVCDISYALTMICPYRASDTKVTNSRPSHKFPEVWRRRQCKTCNNIWTTREYLDLSTTHRVINRDSKIEAFQRDKLLLSIKDSLSHRKNSLTEASALTDTVLSRILTQKTAQISFTLICAQTYDVLMRFDKTAAAVYIAIHGENEE